MPPARPLSFEAGEERDLEVRPLQWRNGLGGRVCVRERATSFAASSVGRSALAMVDQMLVSAANFLLLVSVARMTSVLETGYYVLALRAVDFLTEIQNVFLWAPYTLFAPEYTRSQRKTYAGSVLIHQIGASLASILLPGAVAFAAFLCGAHEAATIALWCVVGSAGIHAREFVRRICFANFDFVHVLAMDGSIFLLQVLGLVTLFGLHRFSGWSVLLITSSAALISAVVYVGLLRNRFKFDRADIIPSLQRNISYGRWLLGSDLTLLVSAQIYPWFLSAVSGPAAVALFGAAQAVTNFARMFLIGAQNVLLPSSARACARRALPELRRFVRRSTIALTAGSVAFSVLCLLAGKLLVRMIYGATFASHGLLTFLFSLSIVTTALTLAPMFALAAAKRADANVKINVITLLFHCAAGFLLTWLYGAEGAAWGLALGGLLAALLRWRVYEKVFSTVEVFEA